MTSLRCEQPAPAPWPCSVATPHAGFANRRGASTVSGHAAEHGSQASPSLSAFARARPRRTTRLLPQHAPARLVLAVALAQPPARLVTMSTKATSPAKYPALEGFLAHTDESYHRDMPTEDVRAALLDWYAANRRRLPWRGDAPPYNGSTAGTNSRAAASAPAAAEPEPEPAAAPSEVSAYGVWVSEIMCQQTRVEAVIPYWLAWMEAFPTVEALAAASEEEVNARWAGLGFYRRARMLHEGAQQVVDEFGGHVPQSVEELMRLKGVGRYTAGAISSICFGVASPIVDGNVLRVLSRLCAISAHVKEPAFSGDGKLAWALAQQLVEAGGGSSAGELNQARRPHAAHTPPTRRPHLAARDAARRSWSWARRSARPTAAAPTRATRCGPSTSRRPSDATCWPPTGPATFPRC